MDPGTGEIAQFASRAHAEKAGYTLALTSEQATVLLSMTRGERRSWVNVQIRVANLHKTITGEEWEES